MFIELANLVDFEKIIEQCSPEIKKKIGSIIMSERRMSISVLSELPLFAYGVQTV